MKKLVSLAALMLAAVSFTAQAADSGCEAKATEKKLAGAAKSSFMKKCEREAAMASCTSMAADKKLAGAAKASFVKKCEKDAAASGPKS